jgi:hypothetical protein
MEGIMELFSEIHGRYFYIISEILKAASKHNLTGNDVAAIIAKLGFAETSLYLVPPLINADNDGYYLLKKEPPGYTPILKAPPPLLLTELQKRWLKAIVQDKRFSLFTEENERAVYDALLIDIDPLYNMNHIIAVDMASDGDDYDSDTYRTIFKTLMRAMQNKRTVLITYESGKDNRLSAHFAPYKLEYSMKDDKFRLCAVRMHQERLRSLYKLNLSRITSVQVMKHSTPANLAEYVRSIRMPLPVEIEITNERNGFERIFTQLSNFKRISEYDETTKKCLMKIYYYEVDEMELLITLLSFGPIIRILGPISFKTQFVERIAKQKQLLTIPTVSKTIPFKDVCAIDLPLIT